MFKLPPGTSLSPHLHVFSSPALWTLSFRCFMEASLERHDWLDHLSLVIDSTSSSYSLLGSQRVDRKFQPTKHQAGSPNNQISPLGEVLKSPHFHNKRHLHGFLHFGNFRCFKSSMPEMRVKITHFSFYISLYYTISVFA